MADVIFHGQGAYDRYDGVTPFGPARDWRVGETRTISVELAGYLLGKYPGIFAEAPVSPAIVPPLARNTAISDPGARPGPPPLSDVLEQPVRKLREALATGAYDDQLSELIAAELRGHKRSTAINAIQDRIRAVSEA